MSELGQQLPQGNYPGLAGTMPAYIPRLMTTLNFGEQEWQLAYRVALRVLKTPDQAEDAAQDALISAYQARAAFAGRSHPQSWLYRIAYNTALSHLRKPFARRYAGDDVSQAVEAQGELDDTSPERSAIANQLASRLGRCLAGLRRQDRIAFTERFLLGTTERELGEMLGVTTNAAKQRAFRARRAVRSLICASGVTPVHAACSEVG